MGDYRNLAEGIVKKAKSAGAEEAEVCIVEAQKNNFEIRLGKIEKLEKSNPRGLGIRIFRKKRNALTYTSDFSEASVDKLIKQTIELSAYTDMDEFAGIPDKAFLGSHGGDLKIFDPEILKMDTDRKVEIAREVEEIGMAQSDYITNSEGSWWGDNTYTFTFANSAGFVGQYKSTTCSFGVSLVAEKNGVKQTNYWYSVNRILKNLESVKSVAEEAARRTLWKLDAVKPNTQKVPVVFDPEVGKDLLRILSGAISGSSIYRKSSFLVGFLGKQIAVPEFTVLDDGIMPSGLRTRPFDGEGVKTNAKPVVENGYLKTYLCDTYSARKLNTKPTGNADRNFNSRPYVSINNFYLNNGPYSPEEIIGSVKDGLYLTNVHWVGVNQVTGDYSRGAEGIWIKNGELDHPVQEFTVASNVKDILKSISMIGNDLKFRSAISCPTFLVEEMTVSGA